MLLCDWSGRDLQMNEMALRLDRRRARTVPTRLGPMLRPDEIEPFRSKNAFALNMTGYVNGELVMRAAGTPSTGASRT
ncbi:fumarylacetoacetate hydrolase family protein [Pseudonocardia sp. MCCB 268]|nr:fumarylacetoacetate hydrolase family protein [Pseudonocardia cytotoxica]